eukprot:gene5175-5543_t
MSAALIVLAVVVIFSAITGILYYQGLQPTEDLQPQSQQSSKQILVDDTLAKSIASSELKEKGKEKEKVKSSHSKPTTPKPVATKPISSAVSTLASQIFTANSEFYASLTSASSSSSSSEGLKPLVPASAVFSDIFYSLINSNRVFSPVSILNILSVLRQASTGETRDQIDKALHNYSYCLDKLNILSKEYNRDIKSPGLLTTYIAVNQQISLNQTYANDLSPYCKIKSENFNDSINTNLEINRYFTERTEGSLTNAAKLIKYDSKVLIYNTLHLKLEWEYPFNPKFSIPINFTQNVGTKRVFRSVYNVLYKIPYYSDNQLQLIELNFKGNEYSMGFLLPSKDPQTSRNIPAMLNTSYLYSTINKLKPIDSIRVILPKFRLKRVLRLMGWFKQLGITNMFDFRRSSFPLLAPNGGFTLTEIIHDGMVSIDELGTNSLKTWWKHYSQQQQALIASQQKGKGVKKNETLPSTLKANKEFLADRNFLFYIRHKESNLLLFVGDFDG